MKGTHLLDLKYDIKINESNKWRAVCSSLDSNIRFNRNVSSGMRGFSVPKTQDSLSKGFRNRYKSITLAQRIAYILQSRAPTVEKERSLAGGPIIRRFNLLKLKLCAVSRSLWIQHRPAAILNGRCNYEKPYTRRVTN